MTATPSGTPGAGHEREIALLVTDFPFESGDIARLSEALSPGRLQAARGRSEFIELLQRHPETDMVCVMFPPDNLPDLAPGLRWLALASAGADHVVDKPWAHGPQAPLVTTASGVHAIPISEYAFSAMLLWAKRWPDIMQMQHTRNWPASASGRSALAGRELAGDTLLVLGFGAIGRRIAQVGRAFGMRVVATKRAADPGAADPDVDELAPADQLDALLPQADYIVVAVPSTPETRGLISAQRLSVVKPGAFLINVARGDIIDEPALIAALSDGRLGGAALDVAAREPLAADDPLWSAPNLILSPHISGFTPHYSERLADVLVDNIGRYRVGAPMRNVVRIERGY